ncbi:hypothetical protein C483_10416 [Natrialba hulunbeirensis JCM 10989]|uniref:HicB family protein n=1 Tax=Natrialba hulunbeirensis JCM 10989 TaxID=1227493 RepID=L9ZYD4_9EURY|nr:hypothetical protein [Natrialba hulunbeirensis]ELY91091.1 hypothetical protein C483_10416 [Natrialba hulunbeirensis JCM 10989]
MPSDADSDADADTDTERELTVDLSAYDELRDETVTLRVNENGLYIVDHEETGVSSQGQSEEIAIENLQEAVSTYRDGQSDDTGDDWL